MPHRIRLLLSLALLGAGTASAAVICSTGDLVVPQTTEGLYLNLVTGISGQTEASVPGFDIDPYAAASTVPADQLKFYWGVAANNGAGVVTAGDSYAVLGDGALIGPASVFSRAGFLGDTSAWQAGTTGYLGMRFRNEAAGNATHYGWLRLSTTAPLGFPATIRGWCYEDTGAAIRTPDPGLVLSDGFEG